MASATWLCPACKRRVPNRVAVCHCGTTREQAAVMTPRVRLGEAARGPLPWQVKAALVGLVVVVLAGVVWALLPAKPPPIHPVLGYSEPVSKPSPKASPSPSPRPNASPSPKSRWKLW
jgi:hypothetical protein